MSATLIDLVSVDFALNIRAFCTQHQLQSRAEPSKFSCGDVNAARRRAYLCFIVKQGLGSSHTFCDEEADEEDWGSADQDDWITGACLQLLGSWRRHRVSILGQDDQNEARVKLTPPATVSEYKWHEYVFYMFASVDEEQKEAKLQVAQEHLDALEKLSSQATSNDVRSLVSVGTIARDLAESDSRR